jgi:hypothetical protein
MTRTSRARGCQRLPACRKGGQAAQPAALHPAPVIWHAVASMCKLGGSAKLNCGTGHFLALAHIFSCWVLVLQHVAQAPLSSRALSLLPQAYVFGCLSVVHRTSWADDKRIALLCCVFEFVQSALYLVDPVFGWNIDWEGRCGRAPASCAAHGEPCTPPTTAAAARLVPRLLL